MYLSRLDHLRFFAALMLLLHHFRGGINYEENAILYNLIVLWLKNGSTGVSLFLVLSGFLFCVITKGGDFKIDYKKFIYNRVLRVFPLLVVILFCIICVNRHDSTPMDILRLLTLQLNTGNSLTGWGHDYFPSGPTWTIAVEFQFYLIFPFLMIFLKRYGYKYILMLIIFSIFIKFNISVLNGGDIYYNLYHTIIGRFDQFLVGILFGCLYLNSYFKYFALMKSILISIFLIFILTLLFLFEKNSIFYSSLSFLLEAFCWGGVIFIYLNTQMNIPNLFDKFMSKMGQISFSVYLLHLPVGLMVVKFLSFSMAYNLLSLIFQWLVIVPIIFLISLLSFSVIEKPFMSLRTKYLY